MDILPPCVSVYHMGAVPVEDRRGYWILWSWSYRCLSGIKLGSSERPASTFEPSFQFLDLEFIILSLSHAGEVRIL